MDATVQIMCNKAKATKETMDAASVNRVYQLTPVESPLRRLAVDQWTHGVKPTQFGGDDGELCNEFLRDLARKQQEVIAANQARTTNPNNAAINTTPIVSREAQTKTIQLRLISFRYKRQMGRLFGVSLRHNIALFPRYGSVNRLPDS